MEDMKISHVSNTVVLDEVIADLNEWYGKIAPLTVMHGKVHDYLSMMIDYSIPGKVIICMDDYAKGILDEAPADMDGVALTLVVEHLFDVNEDAELLDPTQAEVFHHLMAKLLFL